ncbi:MAG TPA: hypothetical protein VFB54_04410 [Burkholderiales bacterium]|nr:hypothetical protein [Burkholderiales bacterium]
MDELEARIEKKLAAHDHAIAGILAAIRQLMTPLEPKKRPIGFVTPKEEVAAEAERPRQGSALAKLSSSIEPAPLIR